LKDPRHAYKAKDIAAALPAGCEGLADLIPRKLRHPHAGVGVFGLIYDNDNPYFAGCGAWPDWPAVLHAALDGSHPDLRFRAVSWQEMMGLLELDDNVRDWAREKHGLV
jgi:hypothetical protein